MGVETSDYYELGIAHTAFLGQFLRQKHQISGIEKRTHLKYYKGLCTTLPESSEEDAWGANGE